MGADLAQAYPTAGQIFQQADQTLGFSLSALCWDGPEEELNERMRPGGVWQTTATPVIRETSVPPGATTKKVAITCDTEGASIAYTTDQGKNPHWQLYTGPMTVDAGQRIRAKAIRLGYKESAVAKMVTDQTR